MVVTLQQQSIICASDVTSVTGNADLDYGGGGSGPARAGESGLSSIIRDMLLRLITIYSQWEPFVSKR